MLSTRMAPQFANMEHGLHSSSTRERLQPGTEFGWSAHPLPPSPGRQPRSEAAMRSAACQSDLLQLPAPQRQRHSSKGSPSGLRDASIVTPESSPLSVDQMPQPHGAEDLELLRLDSSSLGSSQNAPEATAGKFVSEEYVAYFRRRFGKDHAGPPQHHSPALRAMGAADVHWPANLTASQLLRADTHRGSKP